VLAALSWTPYLIAGAFETRMFAGFLVQAAISLLAAALFATWWLTNRRVSWPDRLLVLGAAVGVAVLCRLLCHPSVAIVPWLMACLPFLLTAWTAWLIVARKASARARRLGLLAVPVLVWGPVLLTRMDGLAGDGGIVLRWRWAATAEDRFLAERSQRGRVAADARRQPVLQPGDWPGFRGPGRDGVVRGVRIATDGGAWPPRLLWRQPVGPGWSSFAVVGSRVFTQEQRGDSEGVVCLDAATGAEVWAHEDSARFWENLAGAGPRATPAFADGWVFALGATGILNCLDAATGERKWSRDIAADSGAPLPMWGFTSSPLVANDVVIVFAGGEGPGQLLAYRSDSGQLVWTAAAGKISYGSAQLASIAGQPQVLFFSDRGLMAVHPRTGATLWQYELAGGGPALPRSLQPHPTAAGQVLVGAEEVGTVLLDVAHDADTWKVGQRWASRGLKPSFNDFVVHDGCIYGFDSGTFCCIDLETGRRCWREGRYGKGQVLLLADEALLLVLSESGEVVLVAANRERRRELGRFHAIAGKTWNHPAVAHGRLYVRNAEEMACYELEPAARLIPGGGGRAR
jgi:outer membrane protein assembly factor BamB